MFGLNIFVRLLTFLLIFDSVWCNIKMNRIFIIYIFSAEIIMLMLRGCSQMMSAFFGVSDTPWCLCQPIISFWLTPWCFKLTTSFVNHPEPKTIIFRIQFISIRDNRICVTKGVQLSLVRPTKGLFTNDIVNLKHQGACQKLMIG